MFLQVEVNANQVIDSLSQLSPNGGNGYGWMLVLLTALLLAFGYAVYYLFKLLSGERDKRGELIEKSFEAQKEQADAVTKQAAETGKVNETLKDIDRQMAVNNSLLQTIASKNGN